jgi:Ni/Fe-hydrogenase subunit HybB-like protein
MFAWSVKQTRTQVPCSGHDLQPSRDVKQDASAASFERPAAIAMKALTRLFRTVHGLIAFLFGCGALMLITIATRAGWLAFANGLDQSAAQTIIEAVGLLAAAVVALQIAETIFEEEVVRDADISAPTRVRRFLSRFFVVVLVALAIEGLVATFKALHEDPTQLMYAASLLAAVGVLLAAWGVFVHLNRSAEELEPEAMADAKREDRKLK